MQLQAADVSTVSYYYARVRNVSLGAMRFYALLAAILIYGCFGSPTPDVIGCAEIVVGALLIAALPWVSIAQNMFGFKVLAALLFVLGVCGAIVAGAHETLILRDCVAFAFLFMPLLLLPMFENKRERIVPFVLSIILCGGVFAFRSMSLMGDLNFWLGEGDALYYLSNSPAVLCAAIFSALLLCRGGMDWRRVGLLKCFILSLICAVSLAAMAVTLQRASLGMFVLAVVFYLAIQFKQRPCRVMPVLFIAALLSGFIFLGFQVVIDAIIFKSRVVGDNMRVAEWQAVWAAISREPINILFGLGFGGTFESPAVGGMRVNYTHGLLGSVLLKTGLIGLLVISAYLWMLTKNLANIVRYDLIIGLALLAPFVIDVFLYASFKSFEFGLLLTAIMVISLHIKEAKGFESLIFRIK